MGSRNKNKQQELTSDDNDIKFILNDFRKECMDKINTVNDTVKTIQHNIDAMQTSFQETIKKIEVKMDKQLGKLKEQITENEIKLTELSNFKDQTETISAERDERMEELSNWLNELETEIDDLRNRSMRTTLIFKNIPKSRSEKNWQDTTDVLIAEIKKVIPEDTFEKINDNISRAHRGKDHQEKQNTNQNPEAIFANFVNWRYAEKVKQSIINAARKKETSIIVSTKVSKKLQIRINEALKFRRELLKEESCDQQMYVKYPADLMGKTRNTNERYVLVKRF